MNAMLANGQVSQAAYVRPERAQQWTLLQQFLSQDQQEQHAGNYAPASQVISRQVSLLISGAS
jgi:hypothetical protein